MMHLVDNLRTHIPKHSICRHSIGPEGSTTACPLCLQGYLRGKLNSCISGNTLTHQSPGSALPARRSGMVASRSEMCLGLEVLVVREVLVVLVVLEMVLVC